MFQSRLRRLGWALVAACCSAVLLGSFAGNASAADCTLDNVFRMGITNTCDGVTTLSGSSVTQLSVIDASVGGMAIFGHSTAGTGSGRGVGGITDTSGTNAFGVFGTLTSAAAGSSSAAVFGESASTNANGPGVWGEHFATSGSAAGVLGDTKSTDADAAGVRGRATATTGGGRGVEGLASSSGSGAYGVAGFLTAASPGSPSAAVSGQSSSTSANGYGVWGLHGQTTGTAPAVQGETFSTAANATAVTGTLQSTAAGTGSAAVRAINSGTNGNGYGLWGSHAGSGTGVFGQSASGVGVLGVSSLAGLYGFGTYGVFGASTGGGGYAGYFAGNVHVTGTLTKGAGAFRIDHPLDPAHKYLQHSFVESPDMMDVYNGNVVTDRKGFAVVKLPGYFQALNRSFRYQLTILGHAPWGTEARVWDEIANNRFTLRTNKPNVKVSWQVTGIRHDAYANAHRIPVVLQKSAAEQGKYLHPELYGKPGSLSVVPKVTTKALAQTRR